MEFVYPQVAGLIVLSTLVAGILVLLAHVRHRFGFLPLACFVGCLQYLQTILTATVHVPITSELSVSPGSVVLYPATLAAVLLLYVLDGVPKTRSLIFGVLIANLSLTVLATAVRVQSSLPGSEQALSTSLLTVDPRIFGVGTALLLAEGLLVVISHELVVSRARFVPISGRFAATLALVLAFDSVAFPLLALGPGPGLGGLVASHLVGKTLAASVYGAAIFAYLRWVGRERAASSGHALGSLAVLTYREQLERVRLEKERQAEDFARTEALKDELLATVSHELRTPLTSIQGALFLLESPDVLDRERAEMLPLVRRNADRLQRLIDDLLDLQKLESGRETLDLLPRRVAPLVERAVADQRPYGADRSVTVTVDIEDHELRAAVDPQRFDQVVQNLCSNAVKHSPDGATVEVRLRARDARVLLEVSDRGPGVPEKYRETIWERFAKVPARGEKKIGGTGLGLAITRRLVGAMWGVVGSRDREGGGSVFWFELPRVREQERGELPRTAPVIPAEIAGAYAEPEPR